MRILQVTDNYAPATGGLERVVQLLSRELAGRGHRVDVATLSRPDAPATETDGDVTVHRPAGWTRHLRRLGGDAGPGAHQFHPTVADPQLVRRLQELVDRLRPDVVHAHGWILHSCLPLRLPPGTALVASLHDYSIVCAKKTMVHGTDLDRRCAGASPVRCVRCATGFYGPVKGPALALGLAAARYDRVAMFLPITGAVADACLPGVAADRVTVLPAFVADDLVDDAAGHPGPRPDFLPPGDVVLFVGVLGEHKGVGLLVDAHRRTAADSSLVLVGSRRPDTPDLSGTPARPVHVRSGVPHPQIMDAFRAATVVAVPSRWPEPQGLVAVEAMAAGTPVVASRVGGLAELVLPGTTGLLVEPGDAAGLARALDELLTDPVRRRRMGAAGPTRARDFTASAVVPRVLDAYDRARSLVPA